MVRRMWCAGAMLALLAASPALAQQPVMVDIGAFGGLYLPVSDLVEEQIDGVDAQVGQATAVLFGGRVTVWVTETFGVEGGFGYALSDGELKEGGEDLCDVADAVDDPCDANVWMASLKGLYRLKPQPDAIWAIHLGGGVALLSHGGDFWDGVDGTTDIGGVLNVGATFAVSEQVGIRLDVEDFLYSAKFSDPDTDEESDSKFQNDLVFTGGIVIMVGR